MAKADEPVSQEPSGPLTSRVHPLRARLEAAPSPRRWSCAQPIGLLPIPSCGNVRDPADIDVHQHKETHPFQGLG
jgi:hypothetical protein